MAKYIPKSRNVDELIFAHSGGRLDISDAFHSFQLEEDLFADSVTYAHVPGGFPIFSYCCCCISFSLTSKQSSAALVT